MQASLKSILLESRAFTVWMIERCKDGVDESLTWEGVLLAFAMACQTSQLDAHKLLHGTEEIARILIRAAGAAGEVTIDEAERTH